MKICTKPWRLTEGTLIAAVLLMAGLLLQLSVGSLDWRLFAWPVNIVVLAALLVAIGVMHLLRRRVYVFLFMGTLAAAVPSIALVVTLTVVMGLIRQEQGGSWFSGMLTFWPFVLAYTYVVVILGLVIVRQTAAVCARRSPLTSHLSLISHLGLFIALTTATLGHADMQRLQLWTTNNAEMANTFSGSEVFQQYARFAVNEKGGRVELPLAVELKHFIMELYDDSVTPRRYASEVVIYSKASMHQYAATVDVNKPTEVDGWKIYQKDYRLTPAGDACQISILELVSDPWLPWVYAGIIMMLAGALLMLFGLNKLKE